MSEPERSVVARWRPESALILDAARVCLEDADAERLRARLHGHLDWDFLLRMAQRNRVLPLLYHSLDRTAPGAVPPGVLDELSGAFRANALRNLRLTGELLRLLDVFKEHDIAAVPYKGPTLAALAYGDVALRQFVDLDLLLRAGDLARARDLLTARGFRLGYPLTPTQEAAYVEALRELPLVSGEGILVELHVGLTLRDYVFPLDPDRLRQRLLAVPLADRDVPTFSVEDLILVLCAHGARHCWGSLGWVCDLAELIRTQSKVRWEWVLDEARRAHGERLVLLGVALAGGLLRAPIPEVIKTRIQADRAIPWLCAEVGRWLFCENDELPGTGGQFLFHLRARERWRDGARYCLSQALVPRISDWEALTLPTSLSFAYSFLRPLRLARSHGLKWLGRHEQPRSTLPGQQRQS
jgi:hypothetical protein